MYFHILEHEESNGFIFETLRPIGLPDSCYSVAILSFLLILPSWISSKIWKPDYLSTQLHKIWCTPVIWHEKSFENGFETVRAVFVAEFGDFGIFCGFLSHLSLYIVLFSMMFLHFPPERANFAPFFTLNSNMSDFLFLYNFKLEVQSHFNFWNAVISYFEQNLKSLLFINKAPQNSVYPSFFTREIVWKLFWNCARGICGWIRRF